MACTTRSRTRSKRSMRFYSGYIGYERWWTERLRSSFSFGIVSVRNLERSAPRRCASLDPALLAEFHVVADSPHEYVVGAAFGSLTNKDRRRGSAAQMSRSGSASASRERHGNWDFSRAAVFSTLLVGLFQICSQGGKRFAQARMSGRDSDQVKRVSGLLCQVERCRR